MGSARSPITIGVAVFVIAFGLGVFLLSRTGGGPPAPAPVNSPTPLPSITEGTPTSAPLPQDVTADQGDVVLKLRVQGGCEGCQVTARATNAGGGQSTWSATVANEVAQLEMPTPNTLGLFFFMHSEKKGIDTPPEAFVLLRPDGTDAGGQVTANQAGRATQGYYCWAGTTLDTATLRFTVTRKKGKIQTAWADPALPTVSSASAAPGRNGPDCS